MKRIIFLNRYFYPDHSATSQILGDLAFHLANGGHDVSVFTSRQRYDDAQAELPEKETVRGVTIRRLSTTQFGRSALLGRGFDYLSFYRLVLRGVLAASLPGDILIAKTDPPLLCLPAMWAARRRRLHLVNWLQDLYPEVATQLRVPMIKGPLASALIRMRDAALRAAKANVVVGERMGDIVRERVVASDRVHVIPNWCDDEDIQPLSSGDNPLRRQWGLDGRFVVGYSGNLGRGHEFATVLEAAARLRDEPRILFLFVGGGSQVGELVRRVRELELDQLFSFRPYQDRDALTYSLGAPDVHWLSLKPELEGLIVPSKFYGIAAAGRPIVAITARDGEIARLVKTHKCGVVIEPGDGAALAETLRHLATDTQSVTDMGRRARVMLDARFTRRQAFSQWDRLLENIQ